MMACLGQHTPPACPEEVVFWLRSQEVSSTRLRMEGHGKSVGNNLSAAATEKEPIKPDDVIANKSKDL